LNVNSLVQPQPLQCLCDAGQGIPTDCVAGGVFCQDINDLISEIDPHSKGWFNLSDFIEYVNRLRILYDGREYTLALDHQGKLMAEQTDGIHINSTQLRPINTVGERFVPNMIYQLK
jgi:hypothetical protein